MPPVPETATANLPPPNWIEPLFTKEPTLFTSPAMILAFCPVMVIVPVRVCWLRRSSLTSEPPVPVTVTLPLAAPKVPAPVTNSVPPVTSVPPVWVFAPLSVRPPVPAPTVTLPLPVSADEITE